MAFVGKSNVAFQSSQWDGTKWRPVIQGVLGQPTPLSSSWTYIVGGTNNDVDMAQANNLIYSDRNGQLHVSVQLWNFYGNGNSSCQFCNVGSKL